MTVELHDASDLRWRALPRPVVALITARTANRLGAFTMSFLAAVLVADLGATLEQAGAVVAAFGVATIASRLLGGVLAELLGRVPTIVLGLVACALTQLAIALSPSLLWATVGAVGLGLAYEIYEPASQALLADLTGERQRVVAYGLYGAALAVAGAAAGLLAVVLGGIDLRLLLVADAVTCLVAAVLVVVLVAAPPPGVCAARSTSGGGRPMRAAVRDRRLLAMLGAGTGFATVYMALVVGLPLTLQARGLPPEHAGLLLTTSAVTVVVGQPLLRCRALADPFRALAVGHLLLALGLLGTGLATGLAGFTLATVVWSLGDVVLLGQLLSVVSRLAPHDARASYLAVFGLSWGAATTTAPVLVTHGLDAVGPVGLWTSLALVALVLAALQPALARVTGLARLAP